MKEEGVNAFHGGSILGYDDVEARPDPDAEGRVGPTLRLVSSAACKPETQGRQYALAILLRCSVRCISRDGLGAFHFE